MDKIKWEILQKKMWDWIAPLIFEKHRNPALRFDMPSKDDPKYIAFKIELLENQTIARYNWNIDESNVDFDLIDVIVRNFFHLFYKEVTSLNLDDLDWDKTSELDEHPQIQGIFQSQFEKVMEQIFLGESLDYTAVIPVFKFFSPFPEIILSDTLKFRRMTADEKNKGLAELPRYWGEFLEHEERFLSKDLFVLEMRIQIKKALKDQSYDCSPLFPWDRIERYIEIIYYFFLLYFSSDVLVATFIFGRYFYQHHPFCAQQDLARRLPFKKYYPLPQSFLVIEKEEQKQELIRAWVQKFPSFLKFFETQRADTIVTFAFECLISKSLVRHPDLEIFLLVSTFEGLFFSDNYNIYQKKRAISKNFPKFCTLHDKSWKYQGIVLTQTDLREFLELAYELRNNISHPEKVWNLDRKPEVMFRYSTGPLDTQEVNYLKELITSYFPNFIKFALQVFFASNYTDTQQWYDVLRVL